MNLNEGKLLANARALYHRTSTPPYERGYIAYMFAAWPNSGIPEVNPFERGTAEYTAFNHGQAAAVLVAQDMDD